MSGAENPMDTSSSDVGGFGIARFVARQLLEVVPHDPDSASVSTLASRSNMAIDHARRHLRRLVSSGLIVEAKNGGPPRYSKPEKTKMSKKANGVASADVLALLPERRLYAPLDLVDGDEVWINKQRTKLVRRCNQDGGWRVDPPVDGLAMWNEDAMRFASVNAERGGMTVREIAAALDADVQATSRVVSQLYVTRRVDRDGVGGQKDPFRYFVPGGDLTGDHGDGDASTPPAETSRVDGHAAAADGQSGVEYPPEDVLRARDIAEEAGAMQTADELLRKHSKPVTSFDVVADQFDPPAGDDERPTRPMAYRIVIDDVKVRASEAANDAQVLTQCAILLRRILEEGGA